MNHTTTVLLGMAAALLVSCNATPTPSVSTGANACLTSRQSVALGANGRGAIDASPQHLEPSAGGSGCNLSATPSALRFRFNGGAFVQDAFEVQLTLAREPGNAEPVTLSALSASAFKVTVPAAMSGDTATVNVKLIGPVALGVPYFITVIASQTNHGDDVAVIPIAVTYAPLPCCANLIWPLLGALTVHDPPYC